MRLRAGSWIVAALLLVRGAAPQDAATPLRAPDLVVDRWLRGEPTKLEPGKIHVVTFFAPDDLHERSAVPRLARAVAAHAERGCRLLAIGRAGDPESVAATQRLAERWKDLELSVAIDRDAEMESSFRSLAGTVEEPCAFVVAGVHVAAACRPNEVGAVLEDLAKGVDLAHWEARRRAALERFAELRATPEIDDELQVAEDLVRAAPDRAAGWELKLAVWHDHAKDPGRAQDTMRDALSALAARPFECVRFVLDSLLPRAHDDESCLHALTALRRLLRRGHDDAELQVALFLAADAAERREPAEAALRAAVERLGDDAGAMLELVQTIGGRRDCTPYAALAQKACERVLAEPDLDEDALHACLLTLVVSRADTERATAAGRRLIALSAEDDTALNNLAWAFLTEKPWQGRCNALALEAATAMGDKSRQSLQFFMLDTLALAKFENGKVDEAIALQKRAIEACQEERPGYRERLERYEAAKRR